MSDDAPATPIDVSMSDCDRQLDAIVRSQASRPNATALRAMFTGITGTDKSGENVPVAAKSAIQQSNPKSSFLLTPSI
jgi:hypothetical protein